MFDRFFVCYSVRLYLCASVPYCAGLSNLGRVNSDFCRKIRFRRVCRLCLFFDDAQDCLLRLSVGVGLRFCAANAEPFLLLNVSSKKSILYSGSVRLLGFCSGAPLPFLGARNFFSGLKQFAPHGFLLCGAFFVRMSLMPRTPRARRFARGAGEELFGYFARMETSKSLINTAP